MSDESQTARPKITPHQPEPLGLEPTFAFGDRLGLATPGQVMSLGRALSDFLPIFAQQSIREMTRTARTPEQVIAAMPCPAPARPATLAARVPTPTT